MARATYIPFKTPFHIRVLSAIFLLAPSFSSAADITHTCLKRLAQSAERYAACTPAGAENCVALQQAVKANVARCERQQFTQEAIQDALGATATQQLQQAKRPARQLVQQNRQRFLDSFPHFEGYSQQDMQVGAAKPGCQEGYLVSDNRHHWLAATDDIAYRRIDANAHRYRLYWLLTMPKGECYLGKSVSQRVAKQFDGAASSKLLNIINVPEKLQQLTRRYDQAQGARSLFIECESLAACRRDFLKRRHQYRQYTKLREAARPLLACAARAKKNRWYQRAIRLDFEGEKPLPEACAAHEQALDALDEAYQELGRQIFAF